MKLLSTIILVSAALLLFSGCSTDSLTSLTKFGPQSELDLPETGQFFTLDRIDKTGTFSEYVEVGYDGKVKVNSKKAGEQLAQVSRDEVTEFYTLISNKRYDELKEKLKLENSGETSLNETLTLFNEEGRKQIFEITAEDLQTGENTFLPDSWDVPLTKIRRFLGTLTGESD